MPFSPTRPGACRPGASHGGPSSRAREVVLCATPRAAKGRASTTNLAEALVGAQTTDVRSACASAATVDALEGNAAGYQTRVNRALRYVLEAEPALSGALRAWTRNACAPPALAFDDVRTTLREQIARDRKRSHSGAPDTIRTCDLCLRSKITCPSEKCDRARYATLSV